MADLQVGDVVQLKSGGPAMTVQGLGNYGGMAMGPENGAKCVWFDDKNKPLSQVFDVAVLEKIDLD